MAVVGQTSSLSCGAACLLCAALELKSVPAVGNMKPGKKLYILIKSGTPLENTPAWQAAIYEITAGGGAEYSLPSAVIEAAGYLGMKAKMITAKTKTVDFLQWKYPHEMEKCLANIETVAKSNLGDLALTNTQRALHCVRIGQTPAVHWVLQRDDNSYMDPAGGAEPLDFKKGGGDRTDRATMKSAGQSIDLSCTKLPMAYHGTGLAVRLESP
jgi:hypothetical protein